MKNEDLGFDFIKTKKEEVLIKRFGKNVTILRKRKAKDFFEEVSCLSFDNQQQLMARETGNYKRGNEKLGQNHYRNK